MNVLKIYKSKIIIATYDNSRNIRFILQPRENENALTYVVKALIILLVSKLLD